MEEPLNVLNFRALISSTNQTLFNSVLYAKPIYQIFGISNPTRLTQVVMT